MKKLLFTLAVAFMFLTPFAQEKGKDYITMKSDGNIYWIRSGQTIKMMITVPLKNGSIVDYKGTVTAKGGQVTQLHKGDKMAMDGTMITSKKSNSRYRKA